jgi:hypothetical protein
MTRARLLLALTIGILTAAFCPAPATAQVPCDAKLTGDTTLTPTDPIVTGTCPGNGLALAADDITLDCAGLTIKGSRKGKGLRILAGTENVTIQNCVVDGFAVGILLGGAGAASVSNVVSQNNKGDGVQAPSSFNILSNVVSRRNGGVGFKFTGTGTSGEGVVALQNSKAGFQLGGKEVDLSSSLAIENGAQGLVGGGVKSSVFSAITAIANAGDGVNIAGGTPSLPNSFSDIKAWVNGGNGLVVPGTNADANADDGGNAGLANAGAIQCQIAGVVCAE